MKISALSEPELGDALRRGGLTFRTGPFVTRLTSPITGLAAPIRQLYADHSIVKAPDFVDFHIALSKGTGLRRWVNRQVRFLFDGRAPFKPLPYDHAFAMFEWGLNWCVANHAHQFLIVHAAVLEKNAQGVMLPAPIGFGKSTLAAALAHRGWRLLSDELGIIALENLDLVPLPRPVNLKNRSIDVIRAFAPEASIGPLSRDTIKGTVAHMKPPEASVRHAQDVVRLSHIVFPRYTPRSQLRVEPCTRADCFMRIAENSFNYTVHGQRGFESLGRLISECNSYDLHYAELGDAITFFDDLCASAPGTDHVSTEH